MPRPNDLRLQGASPNAILAAAESYGTSPTQYRVPRSDNNTWQRQSWGFYDMIGELEYIANWVGNSISRAKLGVSRDGEAVSEGLPKDFVDQLFGSDVGKSRCLRTLGIQSTISGESYIFAKEDGTWEVYDPSVVSGQAGAWMIDNEPTRAIHAIRTWDRHPAKPREATSPARAALPILNEIYRLTQHVEAQVLSRLKSGGLLLLPNEMTFAASTDKDQNGADASASAKAFVRSLQKAMGTAIADRSDPSAMVPIVVTAEGEHLDKVKLLEFWSGLDKESIKLRGEAIRRLALAMDVPPEVLTGSGDASHWQAWSVDDASIKSHMEPLLIRICGDLTQGYLWPALRGSGMSAEEAMKHRIVADTSELRMRPNRSQEAMELYDRGQLSAVALRRETGFTTDDAPEPEDQRTALEWKLAVGSITPEMSAQAASRFGIPIPEITEDEGNGPQPDPAIEEKPVAVPGEPKRRELEEDAERKQQQAALVAASEQMVFRALERAGNRATNRFKFRQDGVEPAEVYLFRQSTPEEAEFLLLDAFEHVDRFAGQYGANPRTLKTALYDYTRGLLLGQRPHSQRLLAATLEGELVDA